MNTIKEYMILFLIGFALMCAILLDIRLCGYAIIGAALFALIMKVCIDLLYPENDIDDNIDIK